MDTLKALPENQKPRSRNGLDLEKLQIQSRPLSGYKTNYYSRIKMFMINKLHSRCVRKEHELLVKSSIKTFTEALGLEKEQFDLLNLLQFLSLRSGFLITL